MCTTFTMTIQGSPVDGTSFFDVIDPADETVVATAPNATPGQLDAAVAAARAAAPGWAALPLPERAGHLRAIADTVDEHLGELHQLITAEQGKSPDRAADEVRGLSHWLRETATLDLPETVNENSEERRSITRRVPLGVVAAITPWNYPLGQLSFKLGPALLAGNTVVVKPSNLAPLAVLRLGELLRGVVPDGVVNVISGDDALGPLMTAHPGFDKISFTGSTPVGRAVMANAAPALASVTLELGGNDPAIVLRDADIAAIATQLFWAAFANAGQICLAAKRIYVHSSRYDELASALTGLARAVGTEIGPVSNRRQYEAVLDLIQDSKDHGHTFLTGGMPSGGKGFFLHPTIVDDPPESARIVQEEQFGPVVPLLRYETVDEVLRRANAVDHGLGASVWSADPAAAWAVAGQLEAGTVWVNEVMHLSPLVPFGGHKQSGIGVESGNAGLLEFSQPQTITVRKSA
ncbi:aldehyde dehydrogenase family protein [Amycolatopsis sp. NPDC004368]